MTSAEPPERQGIILEGRARFLLPAFLLALLAFSFYRLTCAVPPPTVAAFTGRAMGTTWSVKIASPDLPAAARGQIQQEIVARLERVEALMSTYRDDSELSRFNRSGANEVFAASPETLRVFRVARSVSELSQGAFDVTVGPLVSAWGFGATERIPAPPAAAELAKLRGAVGFEKIQIGATHLMRTREDVVCDLSAIAKGYGVDQVADGLSELGHADFLVEVGGEMRARGRRLDGEPWRVAIEAPDHEARRVWETLSLLDTALATSGDYRSFYEVGGRRYSHTIDPRSGRPVEHTLASVSVLHPEAVWADALATALNVLGPEAGYALAEAEGLAAYFLVRESAGGFSPRETPAFTRMRGGAAPPPR